MASFDRRLIRPTLLEVIDAIEQARDAADPHRQLAGLDRATIQAFVGTLRDWPEGHHQWAVQGDHPVAVTLAWWTDVAGRRHFRIQSGSSADGSFARVFHPEKGRWLPLAFIAREHAYLREHGREPEMLLACACGATGTAAAIRWMGDRCGACHERGVDRTAPAVCVEGDHGPLHRLAFSPDGRLLAGLGERRFIHIWEVSTLRYLGKLGGWPGEVIDLAFSPDGGQLLVASKDRALRFVDVTTGEVADTLLMPHTPRRIALAPDGQTLALSGGRFLEVWRRAAPGQPWSLAEEFGVFESFVAFSDDSTLLAVRGGEEVRLYRLGVGHAPPLLCWKNDLTRASFFALAFSRDGQKLLGYNWDPGGGHSRPYGVEAWELADGRYIWRDWSPLGPGGEPVVSPGGNWLATVQKEWLCLGPARKGRTVQLTAIPGGKLLCFAFAPDAETLATATETGTVRLWPWRRLVADVTPAGPAREKASPAEKPRSRSHQPSARPSARVGLAFSPVGQCLAVCDGSRTVALWDVNNRVIIERVETGVEVVDVAFGGDRCLLVAGAAGELLSLDLSGGPMQTLPLPKGCQRIIPGPDGLVLGLIGADRVQVVLSVGLDGRWRQFLDMPCERGLAAFSPDGQYLAVASDDWLHLYEVCLGPNLRCLWSKRSSGLRYEAVAFLEDTVVGIDGASGHFVVCWDLDGRYAWQRITRNFQDGCRFSPDGRWVAGVENGRVVLEDTRGHPGAAILEAEPLPGVTSLAFSPDGRTLALVSTTAGVSLCAWRWLT